MSEGRVCGRCGAPATADAQNFCGHCGSELPVLVADERVYVTRGENGRTTYYVLLEAQSGRRKEYMVSSAFAGTVAPGDMGIASVQGDHLLTFDRVRP